MNTNPIQSIPLPAAPYASPSDKLAGEAAGGAGSFKDLLIDSIHEVNGMQQQAQSAVDQLATGGDVNLAEVMTAVQKADISFRLMLQMRNKLVQAYEEIKDIRI